METNPNQEGVFYTIYSESKVTIQKSKLLEFWENRGYRKLLLKNGDYELVKITNNSILEIVKDFKLADEVRSYLEEQNHSLVFEEFLNKDYASNALIKLLKPITIDFNYGTAEQSVFFYNNGVVKITSTSCTIIPYEEHEGYLWKHQIAQRDFIGVSDYADSEFAKFICNLCGQNPERFSSLRSIIGYLLHSYKDPSFCPAVILLDEDLDLSSEEARGGKGKSLFAKAIGMVVPYYFKEGKNMQKSRFFFAGVEHHHKVIFFDDVNPDFDFESLFAIITGDFPIEKKYKNEEVIPFEQSPKVLVSSNYMITGVRGYSSDRRKIEFEIAPFYGKELTPIEDFGHRLFDDWDTNEWNKFDSFMAYCCKEFLTHGIVYVSDVNLTENKLRQETHPKFIEFIDSEIQTSGRYDKKVLLSKLRDTYRPIFFGITPNQFSKWLSVWAGYRSYRSEHRKSNGKQLFIIELNTESND